MTTFKNYVYNKITDRHEFDIIDVDLSIVNGLRRVIHSDVPTVGFMGENDVSIVINKNNGPLHNEFMTHRIGMIPVNFTEDNIESFNEDEYVFTCSVKNTSLNVRNVTTHDIVGTRNDVPISQKELLLFFPKNSLTNEHILITRLRQNEELDFTAKLVKSTGKVHSAFSPVSMCAFYYNEDPSSKDVVGVLEKERTYIKNAMGDPTNIRFMIEPESGLSHYYIILKAFEILIDKVHNVQQEIAMNDSTKITIIEHDSINNTFDVNIQNEDDTLGNLMQSIIYNTFIRNKKKVLDKFTMTYVGYYAPHPLEKKIVIRITLGEESSTVEFINVMNECCKIINKIIEDIKTDWVNFQ